MLVSLLVLVLVLLVVSLLIVVVLVAVLVLLVVAVLVLLVVISLLVLVLLLIAVVCRAGNARRGSVIGAWHPALAHLVRAYHRTRPVSSLSPTPPSPPSPPCAGESRRCAFRPVLQRLFLGGKHSVLFHTCLTQERVSSASVTEAHTANSVDMRVHPSR